MEKMRELSLDEMDKVTGGKTLPISVPIDYGPGLDPPTKNLPNSSTGDAALGGRDS